MWNVAFREEEIGKSELPREAGISSHTQRESLQGAALKPVL